MYKDQVDPLPVSSEIDQVLRNVSDIPEENMEDVGDQSEYDGDDTEQKY